MSNFVYPIGLLILGLLCVFQPLKLMNLVFMKDGDRKTTFPKGKLLVWIGVAFIFFSLFHMYIEISDWLHRTANLIY